MKTIKSKKVHESVEMYQTLKDEERRIQGLLKTLRDSLVEAVGDEHSALVGDYLLIVSEKTRSDLDRKGLTALLGSRIEEYKKETQYTTLEIKQA